MIESGMASGHVGRVLPGDNDEAPVRLTGPPGSHHFEMCTIDGMANPHIALAAVLGLSLIGVQKGPELKVEAVDPQFF